MDDIQQPPPYDSIRYTGHSDAVHSFFAFSKGDKSQEEERSSDQVDCEIRCMEFVLYFVVFIIPVVLTIVILFVLF